MIPGPHPQRAVRLSPQNLNVLLDDKLKCTVSVHPRPPIVCFPQPAVLPFVEPVDRLANRRERAVPKPDEVPRFGAHPDAVRPYVEARDATARKALVLPRPKNLEVHPVESHESIVGGEPQVAVRRLLDVVDRVDREPVVGRPLPLHVVLGEIGRLPPGRLDDHRKQAGQHNQPSPSPNGCGRKKAAHRDRENVKRTWSKTVRSTCWYCANDTTARLKLSDRDRRILTL